MFEHDGRFSARRGPYRIIYELREEERFVASLPSGIVATSTVHAKAAAAVRDGGAKFAWMGSSRLPCGSAMSLAAAAEGGVCHEVAELVYRAWIFALIPIRPKKRSAASL